MYTGAIQIGRTLLHRLLSDKVASDLPFISVFTIIIAAFSIVVVAFAVLIVIVITFAVLIVIVVVVVVIAALLVVIVALAIFLAIIVALLVVRQLQLLIIYKPATGNLTGPKTVQEGRPEFRIGVSTPC